MFCYLRSHSLDPKNLNLINTSTYKEVLKLLFPFSIIKCIYLQGSNESEQALFIYFLLYRDGLGYFANLSHFMKLYDACKAAYTNFQANISL